MGMDRYLMELKAAVDLDESTFEGRSAGIGNMDLGDDVIEPGAFKKTIRDRLTRGDVKLLDGHDAMSTRNVWGKAIEAAEKPYEKLPGKQPQGDVPSHILWTKFFVTRAEEAAQAALRKIEERVLNALSIGYQAIRVEYEPKDNEDFGPDDDPVWEWYMGRAKRKIKELKWMETSLVTWGMNPFAEVLPGSVKSVIEKAGRDSAAGKHVSQREVKNMVQALAKLLQGDEERIRQELAGEVPFTMSVPRPPVTPTVANGQLKDDSATAGGDDDPPPAVDDKPAVDAGDKEAAPKSDTQVPSPDVSGDTPAPSTDEEHFPSGEQLEDYLAAVSVMERQLN